MELAQQPQWCPTHPVSPAPAAAIVVEARLHYTVIGLRASYPLNRTHLSTPIPVPRPRMTRAQPTRNLQQGCHLAHVVHAVAPVRPVICKGRFWVRLHLVCLHHVSSQGGVSSLCLHELSSCSPSPSGQRAGNYLVCPKATRADTLYTI